MVEEPLMREVAEKQFVACHFPRIGGTAAPDAGMPVAVSQR